MLEHVLTLMSPSDMRASVGGAILEALIRQYGAGGKYTEARRVFDQIQGPTDAYCLRAMLYACSAGEPPRWEDALSILHTSDIVDGTRGPAKGVDAKALSYAMLACAKADQWEEALNLAELYGRACYSTSKQTANSNGGALTLVPAFNALIAACGRCGQPGVALRVLNDMETMFGVAPDENTYRKAIIACNQAEHDKRRRQRRGLDTKDDEIVLQWWECSLSLLRRMKESRLFVDPQTYSSVISACEAAGQWQRALGVLHSMIKSGNQTVDDDYSRLNLYCFNAAISACEKGGAWVEALELYYRMKDKGDAVTPNFVTLSSLLVALDKAGQKELAQSTYEDGIRDGVVMPWKMTRKSASGQMIRAMVSWDCISTLKQRVTHCDDFFIELNDQDLHQYSAAMANAAIRSVMESLLSSKPAHDMTHELVIIVGKGKGSEDKPVLLPTVQNLLRREYEIAGKVDVANAGRFVIASEGLKSFAKRKQWRS
jgi:pentatricopeptide repeat domain-containing protein 1